MKGGYEMAEQGVTGVRKEWVECGDEEEWGVDCSRRSNAQWVQASVHLQFEAVTHAQAGRQAGMCVRRRMCNVAQQ